MSKATATAPAPAPAPAADQAGTTNAGTGDASSSTGDGGDQAAAATPPAPPAPPADPKADKPKTYVVQWDLKRNGKTYAEGDEIKLTRAELEASGLTRSSVLKLKA